MLSATAPNPPPNINQGTAAPAVKGKNEKNIMKNFFNRFIDFYYITFWANVI